MIDLHGKTVLVTGASSGLGQATLKRMQSEGATVVPFDLQNGQDVTREDDVRDALKGALSIGPLAGVIHCAGILDGARVVGKDSIFELERFAKVINVNLNGTFNVMRLAAEVMSKQGPLNDDEERGVIITTASVAAFEGQIGQAAYSASKGGVASMTLPVARELARFGVRVVCIAPGLFETPMMGELPEKASQSLKAHVQFPKRLGQGAEYAQLVSSIIQNPMLNGCTIRLDGAVRLMPQ